mgnify:CR=1 FL=1
MMSTEDKDELVIGGHKFTSRFILEPESILMT